MVTPESPRNSTGNESFSGKEPQKKPESPERKQASEINPLVYKVLEGTVRRVERVNKEEGKPDTVILVETGAGILSKSAELSIEYSGLINNTALVARRASYFSQRLLDSGVTGTNPKRIFEAMLLHRVGRIPWEQARDYPDETKNLETIGEVEAKRRADTPTGHLALEMIEGKVPDDQFELAAALVHKEGKFDPKTHEELDYEISEYCFHTTGQKPMSISTWMADFIDRNFTYEGKEDETLKKAKKAQLETELQKIVDTRKRAYHSGKLGIKGEDITQEEAHQQVVKLGISEESPRPGETIEKMVKYDLKDAKTEAKLEEHGIYPNEIDWDKVPMSKAEVEFRRKYAEAPKEEVLALIESKMAGGLSLDLAIDELLPLEKNKWLAPFFKRMYISEQQPTEGSSGVVFDASNLP